MADNGGRMVDVMIPYWGDPDLLFTAIESVRRQTDSRWRLTIIDDCYPVDVSARIASLGDQRITYLRNDHNLGIIGNFQRCIELAHEDYMVFFGCDDVMKPNYIAEILHAIERHPEADIIEPRVEVIDEHGEITHTIRDAVKRFLVQPRFSAAIEMSGEQAAARLLWGDWLYWPSLAFKRSTLEGHDFAQGFPIILDLAFLIDLICDGATLLCLPTVAFQYRRHSASASAESAIHGQRFADERRYFSLAAQQMTSLGWTKAARFAKCHLMSRLDALTILPKAVFSRQWPQAKALLGHIIG